MSDLLALRANFSWQSMRVGKTLMKILDIYINILGYNFPTGRGGFKMFKGVCGNKKPGGCRGAIPFKGCIRASWIAEPPKPWDQAD